MSAEEHHPNQGNGEQGHGQFHPPLPQGCRGPPPQPNPQPKPVPEPHPEPSNNRTPPRRVDHTYRDFSNFPIGGLPMGKKPPTNFPSKLHLILSTHEYSHIITWMPHGRAWKIYNKDLLMTEVVPKYFVQSKYESFTRQLNGWGFKRLHQSGNDFNAYYHECFLRGLPYLTVLMKRVPPNQGKLLPHVEGEPNFYEIEKQFRLPPPTPIAPMMPYHEHYPYSPSGMTGAGYGYGAPPPPEMPTGYPSPSHYTSYAGNYPHPPPYYAGHPGDSNAAAAYASQSSFPPYSYYHTQQYSQPPSEHYPHCPYPHGHPYASPLHYASLLPNDDTGPVKREEVSFAPVRQGAVQEERAPPPLNSLSPIKVGANENYLQPFNVFTESENATTESSESEFDKNGKK